MIVGPGDYPFCLTVTINIERYPKEPPTIAICVNPEMSQDKVEDEKDLQNVFNKIDYMGEDGVVNSNFPIFEEWEEQNY